MPITRTPMIDDDGSGTTGTIINNAWKQEFYNQIDAIDQAMIGPVLAWTPSDASGAGLVFHADSRGLYCVIGSQVFLYTRVIYPPNSSGAQAVIGGLPFYNGPLAFTGFYSTLAPMVLQYHLSINTAAFYINSSTGGAVTNAQLTSAQIICQGSYIRS